MNLSCHHTGCARKYLFFYQVKGDDNDNKIHMRTNHFYSYTFYFNNFPSKYYTALPYTSHKATLNKNQIA